MVGVLANVNTGLLNAWPGQKLNGARRKMETILLQNKATADIDDFSIAYMRHSFKWPQKFST